MTDQTDRSIVLPAALTVEEPARRPAPPWASILEVVVILVVLVGRNNREQVQRLANAYG